MLIQHMKFCIRTGFKTKTSPPTRAVQAGTYTESAQVQDIDKEAVSIFYTPLAGGADGFHCTLVKEGQEAERLALLSTQVDVSIVKIHIGYFLAKGLEALPRAVLTGIVWSGAGWLSTGLA